MGSFRIASRYAKSLIDLAKEKGQVEQVFADIKALDSTFESSRELRLLFKSPVIPTDKKLAITKQLFEGKTSELIYSFVVLLIKKGREADLHEIVEQFIVQYNRIKGITPVKLITAVKMESGEVQTMVSALKAKELLKEVELTEEVDPELIGGFILQYGDKMIDQSVKSKLNQLYNIVQDDSYIKKYS
jgi:F-type H+-transporting ATPase subunit delta